MNRSELFEQIKAKKSYLCVGLDSDINKIPKHLLKEEDPVFAFNKAIIDATLPYTVSYKPNLAFYESRGVAGLASLEKTIKYLNEVAPEVFTIADAKRGDIGNTASMYAKAFFENMDFDSVTLSPYMGEDSVSPFLEFKNKWAVVLALTSNAGAADFQTYRPGPGESMTRLGIRTGIIKQLFERVLTIAQNWGNSDNMMFVVGATQSEYITIVRGIAPDHFLLVPGVGAQGGSLEEVSRHGLNDHAGLLINSSRGIIFASDGEDFAERAGEKAKELQEQMSALLAEKNLI